MVFERCDVDPRSGNTLTSPELTLPSDQELTFTLQYPINGNNLSVAVYQTSVTDHPTLLLGTYYPAFYSPDNNGTGGGTNGTNSTNSTEGTNSSSFAYAYGDGIHTLCLPAGTYQLVFIATNVKNVGQSIIAVNDVSLTSVSCTYSQPSGMWSIWYDMRCQYLMCDQKLTSLPF